MPSSFRVFVFAFLVVKLFKILFSVRVYQIQLFFRHYLLERSLFYLVVMEGIRKLTKRKPVGRPVPKNLEDDLKRLEKKGIISLSWYQWGENPMHASLTTELTKKGMTIAEQMWNRLPNPFKKITLETKEQIFPLDPKTIQKKVHREFPEYRKTYVKLDTD